MDLHYVNHNMSHIRMTWVLTQQTIHSIMSFVNKWKQPLKVCLKYFCLLSHLAPGTMPLGLWMIPGNWHSCVTFHFNYIACHSRRICIYLRYVSQCYSSSRIPDNTHQERAIHPWLLVTQYENKTISSTLKPNFLNSLKLFQAITIWQWQLFYGQEIWMYQCLVPFPYWEPIEM